MIMNILKCVLLHSSTMNVKEKIKTDKEIWLVVWSETSTIGKAAEKALLKNFNVIKTSKENKEGERIYLDISDVGSIKWFIENFVIKYPWRKIKVLFLNAGNMVKWDTIHRWNFFERSNAWDKDINTNVYNLLLVESLERAWIIDKDTKIIYNASTQIFKAREWLEDYAKLKSMVSNILLSDSNLDVTVLALSLVQWSHMTEEFEKMIEKKWLQMNDYIKENMPEWQPTLDQVTYITEKIIENREATKGKVICLDWWRIKLLGIPIPEECIYFDTESDTFRNIQK